MAKIVSIYKNLLGANKMTQGLDDEQPVHEELGDFGALYIPVSKTNSAANWSIGDVDYIIPQTQEEHDALLNTFYNQRNVVPDWKEKGREEEQKAKHYNSNDSEPRSDLGAKSSVIQEVAYDPEGNSAWLQMNGKWYQYSATPDQFQTFLKSGSLGKEMNRIKKGDSMSLTRISGGKNPPGRSSKVSSLLSSLVK